MIIKVCGLIQNENALAISKLGIDLIGINFYKDSIRYVGDVVFENSISPIAGVFVNSSLEYILEKVETHNLSYVQLHGDESPHLAAKIQEKIPVIKCIGIESRTDIRKAQSYKDIELILFDKKSKLYGGTGAKFDWDLINDYQGEIPFLLAGGIRSDDYSRIKNLSHELFKGIDINSQFEISPGNKDVLLIKEFIEKIK
jgi:phosphoribosylanthranilate isomerase